MIGDDVSEALRDIQKTCTLIIDAVDDGLPEGRHYVFENFDDGFNVFREDKPGNRMELSLFPMDVEKIEKSVSGEGHGGRVLILMKIHSSHLYVHELLCSDVSCVEYGDEKGIRRVFRGFMEKLVNVDDALDPNLPTDDGEQGYDPDLWAYTSVFGKVDDGEEA